MDRQKFVQYIRMLYLGCFILVSTVYVELRTFETVNYMVHLLGPLEIFLASSDRQNAPQKTVKRILRLSSFISINILSFSEKIRKFNLFPFLEKTPISIQGTVHSENLHKTLFLSHCTSNLTPILLF